jgi:hypothetical protein
VTLGFYGVDLFGKLLPFFRNFKPTGLTLKRAGPRDGNRPRFDGTVDQKYYRVRP